MLQIRHLTLTHRRDLSDLVSDLSFTAHAGERIALIGEEGDGKSTLLRALAGDPTVREYIDLRGEILTGGAPGYLPQELPASDRGKTAFEFFCDSPDFFDQSPRALGALAASLSLPEDAFYSDQRMADFSGGERIKLQLARILAGLPAALLLDEPTNDLDGESARWLGDFMLSCPLPIVFVSHDETLLRQAATGVLLLERLRRRTAPRATFLSVSYEAFVRQREAGFVRQEQLARKEREEYAQKLERYETIRRRVERDQNAISRQDPGGARLLKKKMHTVLATGRRFEREAEQMTAMPEREEPIFSRLTCAPLPAGKTVLDLSLPALRAPDGRLLARDVRLTVRAGEKLLLCGRNGAGKSTLLRQIHAALASRADLRVFTMPQDAGELLDLEKTPLEMLERTGDGQERARCGVMLGSMKFTAEEMNHPCGALSGGQKAKLMFLMMARSEANVLLLDEPTRSLSPLSGPVVRRLFADTPATIIAVSHDALFARAVCTRALRLDVRGLSEADFDRI